jgi:hypothetical protein
LFWLYALGGRFYALQLIVQLIAKAFNGELPHDEFHSANNQESIKNACSISLIERKMLVPDNELPIQLF